MERPRRAPLFEGMKKKFTGRLSRPDLKVLPAANTNEAFMFTSPRLSSLETRSGLGEAV